jgi:hypothetical protein
MGLRVRRQVGALWSVLSQQAIGVLVDAKYFRTCDQGSEPPLDDGNESSNDFCCTPDGDMVGYRGHIRKVPCVDGFLLARTFFTSTASGFWAQSRLATQTVTTMAGLWEIEADIRGQDPET